MVGLTGDALTLKKLHSLMLGNGVLNWKLPDGVISQKEFCDTSPSFVSLYELLPNVELRVGSIASSFLQSSSASPAGVS